MRIERINDHQIRCIVTATDLNDRHLTFKELKYGNQATMYLFHEVVEEAVERYGFNQEEYPLMIEAVPISPDELMITVSALSDSEELDPHFARFTPFEDEQPHPRPNHMGGSFFSPEENIQMLHAGVFLFEDIDAVMTFCHHVSGDFPGKSLLYRHPSASGFCLAIKKPEAMNPLEFSNFLNSLAEFGGRAENDQVFFAYLSEHETPVMEDPVTVFRRL